MNNLKEITKSYLNKCLVDYVLSPTLRELCDNYTPKWNGRELVWYKNTNAEK